MPVYLLTLVNVLSFSLLIPVYPFLVKQYGESPLMLGILMATYSAFQFIGAPVMGALSDRFGRKPILLITQFGTFCSWLIFAAAYFFPSTPLLFTSMPLLVILISRVIDGITGGNISITNAYLSDITPPKQRSVAFGYIGAIFGVGMIIGPAAGAFAMSFSIGYLGTILLGATISLITLFFMLFSLKESLPKSKRHHQFHESIFTQLNIVRALKKYLPQRLIITTLALRFLLGIILGGYTTIITLYVIEQFGLDETEVGFFLLFVGSFLIIHRSGEQGPAQPIVFC